MCVALTTSLRFDIVVHLCRHSSIDPQRKRKRSRNLDPRRDTVTII